MKTDFTDIATSHVDEQTYTAFSPREVISDSGRHWKAKAAESATALRVLFHNAVPDTLTFDRAGYEHALNNLLSNAVNATQSGEISIICKMAEKNGANLFLTAVKDTGTGLNAQQQTQVTSTKAQGGLPEAKRIAAAMGGTVQIRSTEGEGTTALMSLPVPAAAAQSPDINTAATEAAPKAQSAIPMVKTADSARAKLSNISVLAAEDNETNRLVLKSLFEPIFAEMYFAEDGKQAIDILETRHIDIVIMDIHMPIMDGIEATLAIRTGGKPYSNVPIIALTADPEYQQRRVCLNLGMDDAHSKPIIRDRLVDSCVAVLEARDAKSDLAKSA